MGVMDIGQRAVGKRMNFATQDGSGREYSGNSYGSTVGSGGTRSSRGGGLRPGGPQFSSQGGNPASVALDAPRVPNLAPLGSPGAETPQAKQGYGPKLEGQVKAYGDMVGQDFTKQVGSLLGDLNGIGALRSGAVQTGVNDLTTNYGRQIGNYASQTASTAAGLDQQEAEFGRNLGFQNQQLSEQGREFDSSDAFRKSEASRDETDKQFERNFMTQQYNDQKSASKRKGIGKLLGGALGIASSFIPGGSTVGKLVGAASGVLK